jgi:hypothetical protein
MSIGPPTHTHSWKDNWSTSMIIVSCTENKKLAAKWGSPRNITHLKDFHKIKIQMRHNNKKMLVNANQSKPYFVPLQNQIDPVPDQATIGKPVLRLQKRITGHSSHCNMLIFQQ